MNHSKEKQQRYMLRSLCLFNCMQKYEEKHFPRVFFACLTIPLFEKDTREDIKSSRHEDPKKKHKQTRGGMEN